MSNEIASLDSLRRQLAEESATRARFSLMAAAHYAIAVDAEEATDLIFALCEQIDLTAKMHSRGLLPESLSMRPPSGGGPSPAVCWMENNHHSLLATHGDDPDVLAWARLAEKRHLIQHLLPRVN